MKFSWLSTVAVIFLSSNVHAECSNGSKIPTDQAYRVIKALVDQKPNYKLVFGQTASDSSCKVEISEKKQDGSFDLVAKEVASNGSEIRSITYAVPKGEIEANADCSIYVPGEEKNRAPEDNELQWVHANTQVVQWDKEEADGQRHGRVISGKSLSVSLRQGIISLTDAELKPTLLQRFFSVPVNILDCR